MISVCMATYNGESYISAQINSILLQLDSDDEIVIIDDCSSDETRKIILDFSDKRIKLFVNKYNMGPVYSFQRALHLSRGEFIFLADQDDVWKKNKVKKIMEAFSDSSNALIVHDAIVVDSKFISFDHSDLQSKLVK